MAADEQPLHDTKEEAPHGQKPLKPRPACGSYQCVKLFIVIYTIFLLIVGLILLAVGITAATIKSTYSSVNDALSTPAILCSLVGLVIIITAIIGLVGTFKESPLLLKIYLALLLIIFLVQVIIGILAFVFREETASVVTRQLRFAMEEYTENDQVKHAVDHLQKKNQCCGITGPDDWDFNKKMSCFSPKSPILCSVPKTCCKHPVRDGDDCGLRIRRNLTATDKELRQKIYIEGCRDPFRNWVEGNLDVVGAVVLGLAIPQVIGLFMLCWFLQKVIERRIMYRYRKRIYED